MKLPILLAAGFREISGIILGPHHQLTRRLAGERCEVDRERRVSTLVVAGCKTIDPDSGGVVHGAEMEQQTLSVLDGREPQLPAIPARLVEAGVVNLAPRRLWREGNHDLSIPSDFSRRRADAGRVEHEFPLTVQRQPVLPAKLRSRVATAEEIEVVR